MKTPKTYFELLKYDTIELYEYTGSVELKNRFEDALIENGKLRVNIKKVCTLSPSDNYYETIVKSGKTINEEKIIMSRCLPNYTCGLLFIQDNEPCGWISICFSCKYVLWPEKNTGYVHISPALTPLFHSIDPPVDNVRYKEVLR